MMASLRDLANRALRHVEHTLEHGTERMEHPVAAFQEGCGGASGVEQSFPEKTAKNPERSSVPSLRGWNSGTLAEIADKLGRKPCPSQVDPRIWHQAVTDCRALIEKGWAQQAMNLGWSCLEVFGAVPDKHGDPLSDGLAVKLGGRSVVALCGSFATVRDKQTTAFLYRGHNTGARLLWEL